MKHDLWHNHTKVACFGAHIGKIMGIEGPILNCGSLLWTANGAIAMKASADASHGKPPMGSRLGRARGRGGTSTFAAFRFVISILEGLRVLTRLATRSRRPQFRAAAQPGSPAFQAPCPDIVCAPIRSQSYRAKLSTIYRSDIQQMPNPFASTA